MRVLFCKIHCPFICFCKPSPHLYPAGPLKLENGAHVPTTKVVTGTDFSGSDCVSCVYDTAEGKDEGVADVNNREEGGENCRKSNLRKADSDGAENGVKSILRRADSNGKEVQKKKRVQWKDFLGNELAEIREFEPSDEDTDYEVNDTRGCVCVIL